MDGDRSTEGVPGRTGAHELITVIYVFEPEVRNRLLQLRAEFWF